MDHKNALVAGEIIVNSEAHEILGTLCDRFQSRFFATPEEREAAEFLAAKFRAYGLQNVRLEPYCDWGWISGDLRKLSSWRRQSASLQLLAPQARQLSCLSLTFSSSTPVGGIDAEIFSLESGTRQYILAHQKDIEGKLVLAGNYNQAGASVGTAWGSSPSELGYPTIYGYMVQFDAAGLICARRNYGGLPITGPARWGFVGEIPACGISREDSQFIVRLLARGLVTARLETKNSYTPEATSFNVTADLPGSLYPDEVVLVGGHFDGFDISVGAMDDAAGACVVLEAARALAKHATSLKRTIRFCCFAGEEVGLNGSTGYVINHAGELHKIKLMINTDAAGISAKTGHGFEVCGSERLVPYLETVLSGIGAFDRKWELPEVGREIRPVWDHWPFYMRGIPTAHLRDLPTDPIDWLYSHTQADTVDKVHEKGIKDAAVILALTISRIADDDEIPVKHESIAKIIDYLERSGIAENLRVEERWLRELDSYP
jgi:hypothetical protein